MEVHSRTEDALPTKFVSKVMEIPVVKFGLAQATGLYARVKDINSLTHKSFELAEKVTEKVVTPLAQKGICMASRPLPLHKIDDMAAQGLQTLEDKMPMINKEPQAMVSDVTGAVSQKLYATKERVTKVSDAVLVSRPVQTYFDLLEFVLSTASKTLDKVLPPVEGQPRDMDGAPRKGELNATDRGWFLLKKFFNLLHMAKDRVVWRVGRRIETTSNAADAVFKEAKRAVNNALPGKDKESEEPMENSINGTGGDTGGARQRGKKNKGHNREEN